MKLSLILSLPLILVSCSDLTPTDQAAPAPLAPQNLTASGLADPATPPASTEVAAPVPVIKAASTPTASVPPINGPENPLGFLDPNTTGELLTEAKKKTVTGAASNLPSPLKVEGDSAIDVPPPTLPVIKITE